MPSKQITLTVPNIAYLFSQLFVLYIYEDNLVVFFFFFTNLSSAITGLVHQIRPYQFMGLFASSTTKSNTVQLAKIDSNSNQFQW